MFEKCHVIPQECFRVSVKEKNSIELPFDEIFQEEIGFLNAFHLNKKRAYVNIMGDIIENNNIILQRLENKEDIIYNYLAIKYAIDSQTYKDVKEFNKQMREYIISEISSEVIKYVDENYIFDLDSTQTEASAKYKDGLQFTDHHNKILFRISVTMKFCIPLILHYAYINGADDISQFLLKCFDPIFEEYNENGTIDILNKLYESVYSRVIVTRYSDRTYWFYTEIMGINIEGLTDELVKKLITDIVPKYKFDANPISLNHVATQKNVGYAFRVNFPLNFKSMNLSEPANENDVSDFDRLSINTARINEAELCINTANIKQTLKTIIKKFNIKIDEDEIKFYTKGFKINKLQRNLIFLFFAKYFGSTNALYYCNVKEYVVLMIIMKKFLEKNNFIYLNKIISANVESINERKVLNKKNLTKVIESEVYGNIINSNYSDAAFNIMDSNAILKLVAALTTNSFLYNDYQGDNNGNEINLNHDVIAEELLKIVSIV